jgi:hypothetical protein
VAGQIYDLLRGNGIPAASVSMRDSVGTTWDNIGTDDGGFFEIAGTPGKPIAQGNLVLTITKDTFLPKVFEVNTSNPGLTNLRIPLETDPAAASATPSTSAPPITPSLDSPGIDSSAPPPPADGGMSTFSLMLIIVGGLLVLLGIGAIVLLFVRRGDGDGPPGPGRGPKGGPGGRNGGPPGRGAPPGPRRPGMPDRTSQIRPGYGPPRPGGPGQTTISRSPLADNPTQHGRPGPPPYGGPPHPQQTPPGGYRPQGPGPQGGYGQPGQTGYQQPYGQQQYGDPRQGDPRQGEPRQGGPRPPRPEGRRVDWTDDY